MFGWKDVNAEMLESVVEDAAAVVISLPPAHVKVGLGVGGWGLGVLMLGVGDDMLEVWGFCDVVSGLHIRGSASQYMHLHNLSSSPCRPHLRSSLTMTSRAGLLLKQC